MNRKLFIKNIALGLAYLTIAPTFLSCESEDSEDFDQNSNQDYNFKKRTIYVISKESIQCKKYKNYDLYKSDENNSFIILGYITEKRTRKNISKNVDIIDIDNHLNYTRFKKPIGLNFPLEKRNVIFSYVTIEEINNLTNYKQIAI